MKAPRIVTALGYVDDDLVSGAEAYQPGKNRLVWLRWVAMAACLCLAVVGAITLFSEPQTNLAPGPRTNSTVYGVLAEVTGISGDDQFEAVVTGGDENFHEHDAVTVTYKSNGKSAVAIGDTVAITYSKFERTELSSEISAGEIEIVSACSPESGTAETVAFHGRRFPKAELSEATLEWLERYHSLSPEEQLAISAIPADLYAYDDAGTVEELAGG